MRSSAEIFVWIDVQKAIDDGLKFHYSNNDVILTTGEDGWLAPKYFHRV